MVFGFDVPLEILIALFFGALVIILFFLRMLKSFFANRAQDKLIRQLMKQGYTEDPTINDSTFSTLTKALEKPTLIKKKVLNPLNKMTKVFTKPPTKVVTIITGKTTNQKYFVTKGSANINARIIVETVKPKDCPATWLPNYSISIIKAVNTAIAFTVKQSIPEENLLNETINISNDFSIELFDHTETNRDEQVALLSKKKVKNTLVNLSKLSRTKSFTVFPVKQTKYKRQALQLDIESKLKNKELIKVLNLCEDFLGLF